MLVDHKLIQIKYKWKIPKRRIQVDAEFENSNSKSVRNQYVKLKPQSKEIFEMSDMIIMESNIQVFLRYLISLKYFKL